MSTYISVYVNISVYKGRNVNCFKIIKPYKLDSKQYFLKGKAMASYYVYLN